MSQTIHNDAGIRKLAQLIKDIEIAMLTTVDENGRIYSRPMATQKVEFDGKLWFFTAAHSPKANSLQTDQRVNAVFMDPRGHKYVSASGSASLLRDPQKMRELWSEAYRVWFPRGLEDPELCLLCVNVEQAEYWDTPSSPAVYLIGMAKRLLKGESKPQMGDHQKLNIA